MLEGIAQFLALKGYLPHGYCIGWSPPLVWTHFASDLLTAAAYFSLPAALIHFARRRKDFPYRWLLWMFAAFILGCGTTHLLGMIVLWQPLYGLQAGVKAATALVSVATAVVLWKMVPRALALPSPHDLRLANQELDEHRHRLEDLVEQRTAELAAAKLEAERANNAKSRFLAAASHDLRQPLSALSLYIDVLVSRPAAAHGPLVGQMKDCVGSLNELLSDLLDLSKLDAGVVDPKVGDFALDEILEKIVASHAPAAQTKGLELRLRRSGLIARTDAVLLQRIVGNLVSNAVRYTRRGGVLVACRRRGGRWWVEVWDTGIGIPADKTGEIFEEFKQLGNKERNAAQGTGLGLAIVARAASLLGLQVKVRSRVGRGSVFALEIPPGEAVAAAAQPSYAHRPVRIALVDDNAAVADAVSLALTQVGHAVVAAASGPELLRRLAGQRPDLVISDYRLAGEEDGFEVIGALRSAFGEALPAILITGDTDPAVIRRMAEKGILVQHKPLDLETLRARIGELMA